MIQISNEWLKKYEIKQPDYEYIEREYIGMKDVLFQPARYIRGKEQWNSKKRDSNKQNARLMFVGDITCFEKQFEEAKNGNDYDFSYEFDYVRPIFEQADLVVGNLETMIFPSAPYRTEKYVSEQNFHCNAPNEFLDAVRKAGIDVLTNANNHDLDTGAVGIGETIDNIERFGFIHTGTFKTEKKHYEIIEVAGVTIAIIAFATDHNNKKCNLTDEGISFLLNDYTKEKAELLIHDARKDGAELVFVCIHWGKENKTIHNKVQTRIAKELANIGADCIIGSHPHVLQSFSIIESGEKKVPVFYSMGNFVSHNVNNQKSRSIIACIDLERKNGQITIKCSYIPIFTSKYFGDKKYVVLPLKAGLFDIRNKRKMQHIRNVIGTEIEICREIKFHKCVEKVEEDSLRGDRHEFDLSKVKSYPTIYDDGDFSYLIYKDYALVAGLSKACFTSSYSVPTIVAGVRVKGICEGAFENTSIMKKINFRKNIDCISEKICKGCHALEGFQITNKTTEIRNEAFAECTNLSAAVMKNKVKKIGSKAFANCVNLKSVKIPANVIEIAEDAFVGCSNVVFYCEKDSYAEQYALSNGFKVITMDLY